jgi:hypothetical protein
MNSFKISIICKFQLLKIFIEVIIIYFYNLFNNFLILNTNLKNFQLLIKNLKNKLLNEICFFIIYNIFRQILIDCFKFTLTRKIYFINFFNLI